MIYLIVFFIDFINSDDLAISNELLYSKKNIVD